MTTQRRKEIAGILGALGFTIFSIFLYALLKNVLHVEGDLSYTTILLLPMLLYAVLSGRVTEFRAGQIEAKFSEVANKSVNFASETIEPSSEEIHLLAKGDWRLLQQKMQQVDNERMALLILVIGETDTPQPPLAYEYDMLRDYVNNLSGFANVRFVALLDKKQQLLIYAPMTGLRRLLENAEIGCELVTFLNAGNVAALNKYAVFTKEVFEADTKNIDALRKMDEIGAKELIVIDKDKTIKGIVSREDILTKLMLAIAK